MTKASWWRATVDWLGVADALSNLPQWLTWGRRLLASVVAGGALGVWSYLIALPGPVLVTVALAGGLVLLLILNVITDRATAQSVDVLERGKNHQEWLLEIAQKDLAGEGVICIITFAQWHLEGMAPYIELNAMIWNGVVWPVTIDPTLTGRITANGQEFPAPPELMVPPPPFWPHSTGYLVRLRQPVTPEVMAAVRQSSTAGVFVAFAFDRLHMFAVIDPKGAARRNRLHIHACHAVLP